MCVCVLVRVRACTSNVFLHHCFVAKGYQCSLVFLAVPCDTMPGIDFQHTLGEINTKLGFTKEELAGNGCQFHWVRYSVGFVGTLLS